VDAASLWPQTILQPLANGLGHARIHLMRWKANPAREIMKTCAIWGRALMPPVRGEIELCLGLGIPGAPQFYGNTIKRVSDIVVCAIKPESPPVLRPTRGRAEKIAAHAPGAQVLYPASLVPCQPRPNLAAVAQVWLRPDRVVALWIVAKFLGPRPGWSVRSCGTRRARRICGGNAGTRVAAMWTRRAEAGPMRLALLKHRGGFPAELTAKGARPGAYAANVMSIGWRERLVGDDVP